jgi:hypothetical protein
MRHRYYRLLEMIRESYLMACQTVNFFQLSSISPICASGEIRLYDSMEMTSIGSSQKRPPISLPFYYGWFIISLCF